MNKTVYHKPTPWTSLRDQTTKIIVHARNKPNTTTARELDTYYRQSGFPCCAYHYVLTGSGVGVMRHPGSIGAAHEAYDQEAVYVCILNYDGKTDLPKQLEGPLVSLLNELSTEYPDAEILSAPALMNLEGYVPFNEFIEERNARNRK